MARDKQDQERKVRATTCPGCGGKGYRAMPAATIDGSTGLAVRKCGTCNGSGRLPGFVPPE